MSEVLLSLPGYAGEGDRTKTRLRDKMRWWGFLLFKH